METIQQERSHYLNGGSDMLARCVTALLANETTGTTFMPCRHFSRLQGTCFADQGGTLYIDFSGDGSNVDYTRTLSISANDTATSAWDQLIPSPYVRFRYTNGAVAQGAFRFYAYGKAVS